MKQSLIILGIILFASININMKAQDDKRLIFQFTIDAPVEEVYKSWTTLEGIKSFFAPGGSVELKNFGNFHIYFFPDAPAGQRGSENNVVLSYEENKMFSFTWDFPPSLMDLRNNQRTVVLIRLNKIDENKTEFLFIQSGWGSSEDWINGYNYFKKAWGDVVLARLKYKFEKGAIDWNNLPDYSSYVVNALED